MTLDPNVEFRRYAILVACSVLALIAIGAYITSEASGPLPTPRPVLNAILHRNVAIGVFAMVLILAIWQAGETKSGFLGWTAAGLAVVDAWMGWLGEPLLHASLAPMVFATLVAIVVTSSGAWSAPPIFVSDRAARFLRPLANAAPLLVELQIVLGAAYRHKLTGVLPHLAGAALISIATLIPAVQALQQFPEHRALHSAATWFVSILPVQVLLGVIALTLPLFNAANPVPAIVATAAHTVMGSLALAASLVFSMQVQRSVRRTVDASPDPAPG